MQPKNAQSKLPGLLLLPVILAASVALPLRAHANSRQAPGGVRYLDEIFPSVSVKSDLAYSQSVDVSGQTQTHLLDLYEPEGDAEARRPALIWIHSGGFVQGSKESDGSAQYAAAFARRGYVFVSINYRLRAPGSSTPWQTMALAAQSDAQAAIRYLRAHADELGIDPQRIAIGGFSAGSITSMYVGYNHETTGDNISNPGYPSQVQGVIAIEGMGSTDFLEAGDPPLFLIQWNYDPQAIEYGDAIIARANELGIPNEHHIVDSPGHDLFGNGFGPDIVKDSTELLFQFMIGGR